MKTSAPDLDLYQAPGLLHAHPLPEALEVNHRLARHIAGEGEGPALGHSITAQGDQGDRLVGNRHTVDAALLGVGRLLGPDRQIKVELVEGGDAASPQRSPVSVQRRMIPAALIEIGSERIIEHLDSVTVEFGASQILKNFRSRVSGDRSQ